MSKPDATLGLLLVKVQKAIEKYGSKLPATAISGTQAIFSTAGSMRSKHQAGSQGWRPRVSERVDLIKDNASQGNAEGRQQDDL